MKPPASKSRPVEDLLLLAPDWCTEERDRSEAYEQRRLIIQTISVVAATSIAGVAVGAALVMSKPRQIVAWSQQPVPVKIAP